MTRRHRTGRHRSRRHHTGGTRSRRHRSRRHRSRRHRGRRSGSRRGGNRRWRRTRRSRWPACSVAGAARIDATLPPVAFTVGWLATGRVGRRRGRRGRARRHGGGAVAVAARGPSPGGADRAARGLPGRGGGAAHRPGGRLLRAGLLEPGQRAGLDGQHRGAPAAARGGRRRGVATGGRWRRDPALLRAYGRGSWVWAATYVAAGGGVPAAVAGRAGARVDRGPGRADLAAGGGGADGELGGDPPVATDRSSGAATPGGPRRGPRPEDWVRPEGGDVNGEAATGGAASPINYGTPSGGVALSRAPSFLTAFPPRRERGMVGWAGRSAASAGRSTHPGLTVGIRPPADRASAFPGPGRPPGGRRRATHPAGSTQPFGNSMP